MTPWIVKTVVPSNVVLQACRGHFRNTDRVDVIFGRETAVELLETCPLGTLRSICCQDVFGTIKDLKTCPGRYPRCPICQEEEGPDCLVMLADSGSLVVLLFCRRLQRFVLTQQLPLSSPGCHRYTLGRMLAVADRGQAVAVAAMHDRLAIFPATEARSPGREGVLQKDPVIYLGQMASGPPHGPGHQVVQGAMTWAPPEAEWNNPLPGNQEEAAGEDWQGAMGGPEALVGDAQGGGWGTVWSMTFMSSPPGNSSLLHVAVLLHRKQSACSEVQMLCYSHIHRTIMCLQRLSLPHNAPGGVLGIPTTITATPSSPTGLVILGSRSIMVLDWRVVARQAAARPHHHPIGAISLGDVMSSITHLLSHREGSRHDVMVPFLLPPPPGTPLERVYPDRANRLLALRGPSVGGGPPLSPQTSTAALEMEREVDEGIAQGLQEDVEEDESGLVTSFVWEASLGAPSINSTRPSLNHEGSGDFLIRAIHQYMRHDEGCRVALVDHLLVCTAAGSVHCLSILAPRPSSPGSRMSGSYFQDEDLQQPCPLLYHELDHPASQPAACMTILPGKRLVYAQEMGDIMVLGPAVDVGGSSVHEGWDKPFCCLSRLPQVGPMLGAVVESRAKDEPPQIYAASGGPDGGIQVISPCRRSPSLYKSPPSMYPGITGLWPLVRSLRDKHHSLVVVSFVTGTRVLQLLPGGALRDVTDILGLCQGETSLCCGTLEDGLVAQVTPTGVTLCDLDSLARDEMPATTSRVTPKVSRQAEEPMSSSPDGDAEDTSSVPGTSSWAPCSEASPSASQDAGSLGPAPFCKLHHYAWHCPIHLDDRGPIGRGDGLKEASHLAPVDGGGGNSQGLGSLGAPTSPHHDRTTLPRGSVDNCIVLGAVVPGVIALALRAYGRVVVLASKGQHQQQDLYPGGNGEGGDAAEQAPQEQPPAGGAGRGRKRGRPQWQLMEAGELNLHSQLSCISLAPARDGENVLSRGRASSYLILAGSYEGTLYMMKASLGSGHRALTLVLTLDRDHLHPYSVPCSHGEGEAMHANVSGPRDETAVGGSRDKRDDHMEWAPDNQRDHTNRVSSIGGQAVEQLAATPIPQSIRVLHLTDSNYPDEEGWASGSTAPGQSRAGQSCPGVLPQASVELLVSFRNGSLMLYRVSVSEPGRCEMLACRSLSVAPVSIVNGSSGGNGGAGQPFTDESCCRVVALGDRVHAVQVSTAGARLTCYPLEVSHVLQAAVLALAVSAGSEGQTLVSRLSTGWCSRPGGLGVAAAPPPDLLRAHADPSYGCTPPQICAGPLNGAPGPSYEYHVDASASGGRGGAVGEGPPLDDQYEVVEVLMCALEDGAMELVELNTQECLPMTTYLEGVRVCQLQYHSPTGKLLALGSRLAGEGVKGDRPRAPPIDCHSLHCVDPGTGALLTSHWFDPGEVPICMAPWSAPSERGPSSPWLVGLKALLSSGVWQNVDEGGLWSGEEGLHSGSDSDIMDGAAGSSARSASSEEWSRACDRAHLNFIKSEIDKLLEDMGRGLVMDKALPRSSQAPNQQSVSNSMWVVGTKCEVAPGYQGQVYVLGLKEEPLKPVGPGSPTPSPVTQQASSSSGNPHPTTAPISGDFSDMQLDDPLLMDALWSGPRWRYFTRSKGREIIDRISVPLLSPEQSPSSETTSGGTTQESPPEVGGWTFELIARLKVPQPVLAVCAQPAMDLVWISIGSRIVAYRLEKSRLTKVGWKSLRTPVTSLSCTPGSPVMLAADRQGGVLLLCLLPGKESRLGRVEALAGIKLPASLLSCVQVDDNRTCGVGVDEAECLVTLGVKGGERFVRLAPTNRFYTGALCLQMYVGHHRNGLQQDATGGAPSTSKSGLQGDESCYYLPTVLGGLLCLHPLPEPQAVLLRRLQATMVSAMGDSNSCLAPLSGGRIARHRGGASLQSVHQSPMNGAVGGEEDAEDAVLLDGDVLKLYLQLPLGMQQTLAEQILPSGCKEEGDMRPSLHVLSAAGRERALLYYLVEKALL